MVLEILRMGRNQPDMGRGLGIKELTREYRMLRIQIHLLDQLVTSTPGLDGNIRCRQRRRDMT
jgi:hypothetical protein